MDIRKKTALGMEKQKNIFPARTDLNEVNYTQQNKDDYCENKFSWTEMIIEGIISLSFILIFLALPNFASKHYQLQGIEFGKQISFYLFLLIALFFWLIGCAIKGKIKIRRTPLDIPIIIFWFSFFLSTIFSVDRWHSFWGFFGDPTHGLLNLTAIIVAYYLILSTFSMKRLRIFLGAIFLSGGVVLFWEMLIVTGLINLQNQDLLWLGPYLQYIPNSRVGSITGTAIFLSVIVVLLATIFLRIGSSNFSKFKKITYKIFILILIIACLYLLLAFYFFVPWIGFFLGTGFFLICIFLGMIPKMKSSKWLLGGVFVYIILAIIFGDIFLNNHKITAVSFPMEINLQSKISWQIAKEAITKHNFFLGSGPATYGYDFSLYRPQDFNLNDFYNLRFYKGSNVFWELLPTLGILGILTLFLLTFSFFGVAIYLLNKGKKKNKIYSVGFMSALIVILVDAFFVRLDGSIIIWGALLAILTLGIILKESDVSEEYFEFSLKARPGQAPVSAFLFLVTIISVIFLFSFLIRFFMADMFVNIANKNKNISNERLIENMKKAITLNDKEGRYYTVFGQQYMEMANSEFFKKGKNEKDLFEEYLNNAISLTFKGKKLMSRDVVAVEAFAQALENKTLYFPEFSDQAIDAYKEALILEPHNANYFLRIGKIITRKIIFQKDDANKKILAHEAKDWFQKSIIEKNNLVEAYFQLALIQQMLDEKDESVLSLQKAIALDNSKPDYFLVLANIYVSRGAEGDYEKAESIYKDIIAVQGNDPNVYLNLGILYEKKKIFNDAVTQYRKVLDLWSNENIDLKNIIQKMIDNAEQGIENNSENIKG